MRHLISLRISEAFVLLIVLTFLFTNCDNRRESIKKLPATPVKKPTEKDTIKIEIPESPEFQPEKTPEIQEEGTPSDSLSTDSINSNFQGSEKLDIKYIKKSINLHKRPFIASL
ncbi:MAG TPA: hypothetical protein VIK89_05790 [Cytophagaceae bacterium]